MAVIPNASSDVLASLWSAAYNAAGYQLAGKFAGVMTERDAYRTAYTAAADDVTALANRVDALEAALVSAEAVTEAALKDFSEVQIALTEQKELAEAEKAMLVTNAQTAVNQANHLLELEQRDRTIERQTLQSAMTSLTDQIGELKALLAIQARSPVPG